MVAEAGVQIAQPGDALGERVVIDLARAMKNVSFYEVGHPVVQEGLAEVVSDLSLLLGDRTELVMKLTNGYLVVQDEPLLSHHASVGNLIGACHRRKVEVIVFHRGVTRDEVEQLVAVLAADAAALEEVGGVARALATRGVRRITVEHLSSRPKKDWQLTHASALDVLRGAARAARTGEALDIGSVNVTVNDLVEDIMTDRAIVHHLSSMKGMDEYTFIHALHLCILAVELGRQIGLPRAQLKEIGAATLLHDVGKVFVPLAILRKPAALDQEEFAVMSRHPADGAAALAREQELPEVATVVAFEHHVHLDYSGYPRARGHRPLHMYSLMTSIVDVYDALTSARPYRAALPPQQALALIREEYAQRLEPVLLQEFLRMLGPYPCGTMLRIPAAGPLPSAGLGTGRRARWSEECYLVVTRPNPADPDGPYARTIEMGSQGPVLGEDEAPLLDLVDPRMAEVVDPAAVGIDLRSALQRAGMGLPA